MDKLLYYPYINLPKTAWTVRTLLYYDQVGCIVPSEYWYEPKQNYEPFMLDLVQRELVLTINPMEILDNPTEVTKPLLQYLEHKKTRLNDRRKNQDMRGIEPINISSISRTQIYTSKFDKEVFYALEQLRLAVRLDEDCYMVDKVTADYMMKYLATILSAKLDMQPATDTFRKNIHNKSTINSKRETILRNLIPFPEEIDLTQLMQFKNRHHNLLNSFKNKVEQIALDGTILEGTPLFNEKVQELILRKEELTAKMNESKISKIIFGTVCGIISGTAGLSLTGTVSAAFVSLAGFASAVYSGLQIEKAEDVFDQSGMKYLALVDKRLRQA